MINRKLLAALVGLSLAGGAIDVASAQTTTAPAVQPAPAKPVGVRKHSRMHKATHRKHVAHRATAGTKVAEASGRQTTKRTHVSRNTKHATKHV